MARSTSHLPFTIGLAEAAHYCQMTPAEFKAFCERSAVGRVNPTPEHLDGRRVRSWARFKPRFDPRALDAAMAYEKELSK